MLLKKIGHYWELPLIWGFDCRKNTKSQKK